MTNERSENSLFCRGNLVGSVKEVFESDGTWYGKIELVSQRDSAPLSRRIEEFIQFSCDWNDRMEQHPDDPPDASEFDDFADLIAGGVWSIESKSGVSVIADAPVFVSGGDVSWRLEPAGDS